VLADGACRCRYGLLYTDFSRRRLNLGKLHFCGQPTYQVMMYSLNSHVPMLGSHLSLFTVLWTVTTLLYTWYNFKKIDTTSTAANPALKYMQYIMPVFFMAFFNSFASGLTCYLVFSNIINIVQTLVTKNYLISQDKIERELENYKRSQRKRVDSQNGWVK
jgi:YidC/Oxa1 family membrane protein insertase